MADSLFIVIPAYNEGSNIRSVLNEWYSVCKDLEKNGAICRIIVANDGSTDNTFFKLKSLAEKIPILEVIDKDNSGHGATIYYLYRYALESKADYIFQTDSDGQTVPVELFPFWEQRRGYDLIIGNRNKREDGIGRVFVTNVLKVVLFFIFGVWIKDANSPFRLMKSDALKQIIKPIPPDFALTNAAICAVAAKMNKTILWDPITFKSRQGGKNSINYKRIVTIGLKALSGFRKVNKTIL